MEPHIVDLDDETEEDLLVHDVNATSPALAALLASLEPPNFPTALGVFRQVERPTYDELLVSQIDEHRKRHGTANVDRLLQSGTTWEVD